MSLAAKDKRKISNIDRTIMTREELEEYIDEKNAFKSMYQEYSMENRKLKEKDKPYKDVYAKSAFNGA